MKSVSLTITAQVFLDENDIAQAVEGNDGTTRSEEEAVTALAMEAVPNDMKIRDIIVDFSSLS